MDEITKFRITGAIVWLALLILLVPSWYGHPVQYDKVQPAVSAASSPMPVAKDVSIDGQKNASVQTLPLPKPSVAPEPKTQTASTESVSQSAEVKLVKDTPKAIELPVQRSMPLTPPAEQKNAPLIKKEAIADLAQQEWLVRVASYGTIEAANRLLARLEMRYQVTIGDFSSASRKVFSVRVGPYASYEEAMKAKKALDAELKTDSVVVQVR